MVPTLLVHLESLPLTLNGKLDRKALPEPSFNLSDNYIAPRNELERKVCQIWAEVLNLPESQVGINADFFRLGGDSIVSIQLTSRLRQRLSLPVSVKEIFQYKTILRLFDNVLNNKQDSNLTIKTEQELLTGELPLLPIQEWFFINNFKVANHWNQAFIIKIPPLELNLLEASINKLIKHHDSLRLRYKSSNIQYYASNSNHEPLKILNINTIKAKEGTKAFNFELQKILTNWQSDFNLEQGPVYSIGYIYGYKDGSARLHFALHHLIVDAVSWRILTKDLQDLYNNKKLGVKGSSYRQWAQAIKEYAITHADEKEYWHQLLIDYNPNILLGTNSINYVDISLNTQSTQLLLKESNKAYNTQINDLLLTALNYALSEITGNRVNHIILEGHGREEIDSSLDVTNTVGWFTTMYPVRLELKSQIGDSIKTIKEILRSIPNKGIGYGALVGYQGNILPKISFNYLGRFEQEDSSFWFIHNEASGLPVHEGNTPPNIININGLVIDGELKFNIATKLKKEVTLKLAKIFKLKLKAIIAHCMSKDFIEYTMNDFDDFQPYVTYNGNIQGSNIINNRLFIFPPGHGGAESYFNNIVLRLCNKNLVLFNNYYIYLISKFGADYVSYITFEKLAAEYICYMKKIQPNGPYNLFGWSFGGVLAFEISRQLINLGEIVKNMVLVDSYFNYKNVAIETCSQLIENSNINYKYSPSPDINMGHINIVLFKASKYFTSKLSTNCQNLFTKDSQYKIDKYYAENTVANNLDQLLLNKNFKIISLGCDHYSWVKNFSAINKIAKVCQEILG
jgi:non-ribosomal peptide synthase protein (TIGR01720 family)